MQTTVQTLGTTTPAGSAATDGRPAGQLVCGSTAVIVIFGSTGDLCHRKLVPSLFNLWRHGHIKHGTRVVGIGRKELSDDAFRESFREGVQKLAASRNVAKEQVDEFLGILSYHRLDFEKGDGFEPLRDRLDAMTRDDGLPGNVLFYLAVAATYFSEIVDKLAGVGLLKSGDDCPWRRVIIEKPFGHDTQSAVALDKDLSRHLGEDQVYRIDHYLGKETVQNILSFRFGNAIFEPMLHRHYVDHVEITMAEDLGMEGRRGAFYDQTGTLRDVFQNHLLQLLALVAMDAPTVLREREIRDEKLKILRSLVPVDADSIKTHVVRGQYTPGDVGGKPAIGYLEEAGVASESKTETFVAIACFLDHWRWAGVPFLIRCGKRLPKRATEISVHFKLPPLRLYSTVECEGEICSLSAAKPNSLVFRIQPDEGIDMTFSAKRPGAVNDVMPVKMAFAYKDAFVFELPDAYERLILDALNGDATLFTRSDEVKAAWEFMTPILQAWEKASDKPLAYQAGSWGPAEADDLAARFGTAWRTDV